MRITVGIGHRALGIGHPGHHLSSVWGPVSWFLGILAAWMPERYRLLSLLYELLLLVRFGSALGQL